MNLAIFGGTFDPIHRGHIAIARAARDKFELKLIYFVANGAPPHRPPAPVTEFEHRYAMVALATQGEKTFVPSLLEAPRPTNVLHFQNADEPKQPQHMHYSIDTVRRLERTLGKSDKLFFIVGIDAFLEIATWREPLSLLSSVEFIIAARPGYSLADVASALPESIRPRPAATLPFKRQPARGSIMLPGARLHLLEEVHEKVSATQIRTAAAGKRKLENYVGEAVAEYIRKQGLYRESAVRGRKQKV
jgi:nicotinate-nucleotide adenylyltransferase